MHKCVSFFLILLILLNTGGFYALFCGLEYKISQGSENKIDSGFLTDDETLLLKIPIKLPYASNLEKFKRVDGVIEHEGRVYRLVKQRYHKDTLQVVVYNDKISTLVNKVKLDFAKNLSDNTAGNKRGSGEELFKDLIKDYITFPFYFTKITTCSSQKAYSSSLTNYYLFKYFKLPLVPPELV